MSDVDGLVRIPINWIVSARIATCVCQKILLVRLSSVAIFFLLFGKRAYLLGLINRVELDDVAYGEVRSHCHAKL